MNKKDYLIDLFKLKEKVLENPDKIISEVYHTFRDEFIHYGMRMNRNKEDILDAYQDAIIALNHNVMWDKVNENNSSVKTYLFSIGKYKILSGLKKISNYEVFDSKELEQIAFVEDRNSDMVKGVNEELLKNIESLGTTCQKLLDYFYYRRYSIEAIMNVMNMKNENSVKANKSRCIKKLRELMVNDTPTSKFNNI